MKFLTRTFNLTSPLGLVLSGIALLAFVWLLIAVAGGFGFRFDPFNSAAKRADRAEGVAAVAVANGSARAIESAGANDTTARVEAAHTTIRSADAIVARSAPAAEAAPDANLPIEPARLDRLLAVDRELCALRPLVCAGGSAPPRDAGDFEQVLLADPATDRGDPLRPRGGLLPARPRPGRL